MSQQRSTINLQNADLDVVFHNERSTARHGNVNIERHPRFVDQGPNLRPQIANAFTNYDSTVEMRDINVTIAKPIVMPQAVGQVIKNAESSSSGYASPRGVFDQVDAPPSPFLLNPPSQKDKFSEIGIEADPNSRWTPGAQGDVSFLVNGYEFTALRMNLYNRSVIFKALFEQKPSTHRFVIKQVNPEVFKTVLDYLSDGNIGILHTQLTRFAPDLLRTSHKFGFVELKDKCEDFLMSSKTFDYAIDLLLLAEETQAQMLKQDVIKFIISDCPSIVESDDFKRIGAANFQLALDLHHQVKNNIN